MVNRLILSRNCYIMGMDRHNSLKRFFFTLSKSCTRYDRKTEVFNIMQGKSAMSFPSEQVG
jgi:hypothetical protein